MREFLAALAIALAVTFGAVAVAPFTPPSPVTAEVEPLFMVDLDLEELLASVQHAIEARELPPIEQRVTLPALPRKRPPELIIRASQHIGQNPTGWRSLWCGRFLALIAPEAAKHIAHPNWARAWAELPKVEAKTGAIVVLTRGKKAGHIGVVKAFDKKGNPIVISGNSGRKIKGIRTVTVETYPKKRVIAYVEPPDETLPH